MLLDGVVAVSGQVARTTEFEKGLSDPLRALGGLFEAIIDPTVQAFLDANVERLLPAHCTGWMEGRACPRAGDAGGLRAAGRGNDDHVLAEHAI